MDIDIRMLPGGYVCYQGLIMLEEWDERCDSTLTGNSLADFDSGGRPRRRSDLTETRNSSRGAWRGHHRIRNPRQRRAAGIARGGWSGQQRSGSLTGAACQAATQRSTRCKLRNLGSHPPATTGNRRDLVTRLGINHCPRSWLIPGPNY